VCNSVIETASNMCYHVVQRAAVCCSVVLQCVAMWYSVMETASKDVRRCVDNDRDV